MATGARGRRAAWPRSVLLALVALAGLLNLCLAIGGRIVFPWPLEWMEGATLHHVQRLLDGAPLYGPPEAEFVPFVYPPLAYAVMAPAVALGGELPALRCVSALCTLLALVAVGMAGYRAGAGRVGGLLCAGIVAWGYGYSGAFADLARVDALFVALVALGMERLWAGRLSQAITAFCVSALAKQHGLVFVVAISIWLVRSRTPGAWRMVALTWSGVALAVAAAHLATGGWSTTYLLRVPAQHGAHWRLLLSYPLLDVLLYLPALALAVAVPAWRRRSRPSAGDWLVYAGLVAGALGRAHPGGADNVRWPTLIVLVVPACAVLVPTALRARAGWRGWGAGLALCVQCLVLAQPPGLHWPSPTTAPHFRSLRSSLRACAGGGRAVWLDHALLTGIPFLHTMALSDLRAADPHGVGKQATGALFVRLSGRSAPEAVGVGASFPELDRMLAGRYHLCQRVRAPMLATGYQTGAVTIWGSEKAARAKVRTSVVPDVLEWQLRTRRETRRLGAQLAHALTAGDLVVLEGSLGAGKTFLVRAAARALGVPAQVRVTSPTFALLHELPGRVPILHADLYRLCEAAELAELGLCERVGADAVVFVEWGERFLAALGGQGLVLRLDWTPGGHRRARAQGRGGMGRRIVEALRGHGGVS